MKKQTKRILLLFVPLLVFGAYLIARHIIWKTQGRRSWDTQHKLESAWSKSSFYPITSDADLIIAITPRLEQRGQSLDSYKATALAKELAEMLGAYSAGTPDAFSAFRFPSVNTDEVQRKWNPQSIEFEREALRYHGIVPQMTGDEYSDNVELARQFFTWSSTLTNELGQRRWCASCWTHIAPDTLKVIPVESASSFVDPEDLARSEGTINFTRPQPLIAYTPKSASQTNLFTKVGFTVQTNGNLKAYRVYISFYWAPHSAQWIPLGMILPVVPNEIETLLF